MRILVVTANFSPRGASPAIRTVHLVRELSRLGHEITVLTYDTAVQLLFSPNDDSLSRKVPQVVKVERIPAGAFHQWALHKQSHGSIAPVLRTQGTRHPLAALIVPDPHIAAKRCFERRATKMIREFRPQVLLTFTYPFTMTLVGAHLKRRFKDLIWIADYGDPWTGAPLAELNRPSWRKYVDRRLERRALSVANAVTVTTQPTAELYTRQFPELAGRVHVLTMGFDPDDMSLIAPAPRPAGTLDRILLVHAGRLYEEARDPAPFIKALDRLGDHDPASLERLRIHLLGDVAPHIRSMIAASKSRAVFSFGGWVPVEESIAIMKAADYVLLFGNKGAMQVPGKVYQYIGTGRPVFMTAESDRDPTVAVLKRCGRCFIVPNIEESLFEALTKVSAGAATEDPNPTAIRNFAWPSIAASLSRIMETGLHAGGIEI